MSGRAPSGQAAHASHGATEASPPFGEHPSRDDFENDTQRGYAAWERGESFDKFQSAEWCDGWKVADDHAWWQELAERLGASVHGFSHRYAGSLRFDDEVHSLSGKMLEAVQAIATAARSGETTQIGSTEGKGAGLQGIAQTPQDKSA